MGCSDIGSYMRGLLSEYDKLRGKPLNPENKFWDVVVISASDVAQHDWYLAQLQLKIDLGDLPIGVPMICVPDPPGPRMGSGGATLNILKILKDKFGEKFFSLRVLLIHSGGYSKRLPSHTCSGKIFSPLPILPTQGGPYQMLDLKLALYLPFLECMEPGVFITASDDIEVFNIDSINYKGSDDCITALAHPASLYTGTTHGVYIMEQDQDGENTGSLVQIKSCLEVLQKPSKELMSEKGAILNSVDSSNNTVQQVFSDSAFWFHSRTTKKLLKLAEEISPVQHELCIYGDFLTFLGSREYKHYVHKLQGLPQSECRDIKLKLGSCISDQPLNILKLNQSKFYHLGTSREYLDGLTDNKDLREELNLHTRVHCRLTGDSSKDDISGVILNSCITADSTVHENSIVEYSIIQAQVSLNSSTILSNVYIEESLSIPGDFLYHTVPIRDLTGAEKFVTVAFGISDDLKICHEFDKLKFGGMCLTDLTKVSKKLSPSNIFPSQGESVCLWSGKIFPAAETMGKSFSLTTKLMNAFLAKEELNEDDFLSDVYSMADVLQLKNCAEIIKFRRQVTKLSSI